MRRLAVALCFVSGSAWAQGSAKPLQSQGDVTFSLDKSRNAASEAARAKAVAGDCKGALDLYDEALRHSIDATLYRDRGLCHEKLGNIYPAIDDYRAYVSQMPSANDADKFRQRLDELVKDASQDLAMSQVGNGGGTFDSEMRGGAIDGSTPVHEAPKPKKSDDDDDKIKHPEDPSKPLDKLEDEETRNRQAQGNALRKGHGFVFGAYLYPRYVFNPWFFQFGTGVGLKAAYSLGATSSLVLEVGYIKQLSGGTASSSDGLTTMFAYEARVPFDRWADNQMIVSAGGGYENLEQSTIGQAYASFVLRGRAGYRHVFGTGFALDFLADGGLMGTAPINAAPNTKSFGLGGFIGGQVLVSVGF